jgi:hypothetical protein|tara:strand:- start:378 stop:557 length:180 start_codon:yes stop_codon:yes gene_type:complete
MGLTISDGTAIYDDIFIADHLGNTMSSEDEKSISTSESESIALFGTIRDLAVTFSVSDC